MLELRDQQSGERPAAMPMPLNTLLGDKHHRLSSSEITTLVSDARARTLSLIGDLTDAELEVPFLPIVNPPLWELGHIAHFFDVFVLRNLDPGSASGREPFFEGADETYDSFRVAHEDRWALPLPARSATLDYMKRIAERVIDVVERRKVDAIVTYLCLLATLHEDMHGEAFTYTRQTLGYRRPATTLLYHGALVKKDEEEEDGNDNEIARAGPLPGDVEVPGGRFALGANEDTPFLFDNEKWGHPVEVAPFRIARAPVTNEEYAEFVDAGGYEDDRFWSYEGKVWRSKTETRKPVYWVRDGSGWRVRSFDSVVPLAPHAPVVHVCWHEAQAFCRWANRRLPTESEWEFAASVVSEGLPKRRYPWGDEPPSPPRANLDGRRCHPVDVAAFPSGDSAFGCRQMIGNVWEWTESAFYPYPGFIVDFPYKEYSAPWFGYQKVLRGGAFATRSRLITNTYRNFFLPDRRDVYAGFRTCAV
jgi:iron(II)-dependent oxidoreductase